MEGQRSDYHQLMARLRRDEENRVYSRMVGHKSDPGITPTGASIAAGHASEKPEDEITYAEVNRQMTLIINVLVSIVTCAVAIWLASYHWSTPTRLALSLSGSLVVAVAEVTIYAGYLRRLGEAKTVERARRETKVVTETWVIEKSKQKELVPVPVPAVKEQDKDPGVRSRVRNSAT